MTALKRTWARNTSGLEASAKRRTEAARRRVDDAIATLLRDPSRPINFNTVAAAAAVTTAYLIRSQRCVTESICFDTSRTKRDTDWLSRETVPRGAAGFSSWPRIVASATCRHA